MRGLRYVGALEVVDWPDPLNQLDGLYVGVPVIIGRSGIEKIIEVELSPEENSEFRKSVAAVAGLVDACKGIDKSLQQ